MILLAGLSTIGCVTNPATGKKQLSLVSESQATEIGRQSAEEVVQQIGLYDDPALQKYVSDLGLKLAKSTERPDLPWKFQVVDDPAVNAFALPGGFIFVTRGILTHINSEASLATVLGHEIGHVTAQHSINQMSKQELAQLGLGVGAILSPTVAQFGQVFGAGLSLLFLKYGRDAETQADLLGFRYTVDNGYDVRAMVDLFETLDRVQKNSQARLPQWLSTHPDPGNRIEATKERLASINLDFSKTTLNRDGYLEHLNGVVFGENPRNGFFRGQLFLHPELKFQLEFPSGWQTQNAPDAVAGLSPEKNMLFQLSAVPKKSPEQLAREFLSQQGLQSGQTTAMTIAGQQAITAPFAAQTEQGTIQGIVSFFSFNGLTFGLLGYGSVPVEQIEPVYRRFASTFQSVTDPEVLNIKPARVEIVRVPSEMTLEKFHSTYPSSIPLDQVALINGLQPSSVIPAGTLIKRVVGGPKNPTKTSQRE
jgi:predicted Zn-dependent protease